MRGALRDIPKTAAEETRVANGRAERQVGDMPTRAKFYVYTLARQTKRQRDIRIDGWTCGQTDKHWTDQFEFG